MEPYAPGWLRRNKGIRSGVVPTLAFIIAVAGLSGAEARTLVRIKEIRTFGNKTTSPNVILHYCAFDVGDQFEQAELDTRIERTRDNLAKTLFFSRVNVFDLPRANPSEAVIMIDVAEGTPLHLTATTRQARLSRDNIGGQALSVGCEFGFDRESVFYEQPWVFDLPLVTGSTIFYDPGAKTSVENDAGIPGEWFFHEDAGAFGGLGYMLTPRATLGLDLFGQYSHYYAVRTKTDPWGRLGVGARTTVASLRPYFKWDRRDSDVFPTRNTYVEVKSEFATGAVGDYEYAAVEADCRTYFSLGPRTAIALQVLAGAQTDRTPYIRRLAWGGADGLRSPFFHRVTGTRGLLFKTELRRRLFVSPFFDAWFEGLWFGDVGRTWDPGEAITFEDLGAATGPGVRLHMRDPLLFDWRAELNVEGGFSFYASARRAF